MHDWDSIEAIINALYDVISAEKGAERDWERERSLFYPGARLIRTSLGDEGLPKAESMDVETYIRNVEHLLKDRGFYEHEIKREISRFGNFAHVLSSYEARENPNDTQAFKKGVNSIQLYCDGHRWWIVHMIWDNERDGLKLPENLT